MELVILGLLIVGGLAVLFLRRGQSDLDESAESSPELDDAALLAAVRRYGLEVAVAGESHRNDDGTPRRKIIAQLDVGDMVALIREPHNRFDANAIKVRSLKGDIGYVNREQAVEIAAWIDRGEKTAAFITSICGGPDNDVEDYGVWLRVVSFEQLRARASERGEAC